jgi:DNA-binding SARP family transcriptional activator/tetratricopeptide (TPR) repeat protein/energy-coupling factor transporter ATP-binding protein EcfA2
MSLKIYLLGQFNLQADDHPIELPSRPAQSLLAYLVLYAGVAHRREKLASLLWPETVESNARGYLRQALWRIRKSFSSGSLNWKDYLQINDISVCFKMDADYWLDVNLLVNPAEPSSDEVLMRIVNQYQGELLPGFYDDWIVLERDKVQAAYHQKMNLLLECLVKNCNWNEVINWSEKWILFGFSPEPAYRALMRAYAGLGDQSMVATTYMRCEDALDQDLALEPSLETKQLYEQLRQGQSKNSDLISDPPAPSMNPPGFLCDVPPEVEKSRFVARESELAQLENYFQQVNNGQGRVVFIIGEAGSGKTSLLQEFSQHIQESFQDVIIAKGNCNAHSGIGDPYLPYREILELLTGDVESRWVAGAISTEHARNLWNTVPTTIQAILDFGPDLIGTYISGMALLNRVSNSSQMSEAQLEKLGDLIKHRSTVPIEPGGPQSWNLFVQYTRVLQELIKERTLVLIIDDLQWADPGSIDLLFHVGREIPGYRILLIGAYRPEEVALDWGGERNPLESVINELKRQYGESTINLDKIRSQKFIEAVLDCEPNLLGPSFREMLFKQTAGHPLFTVELLRGLQDRGDLIKDQNGNWVEGPELNWEKIPGRIEAVIAERIGRLKQPMKEVLRVASVEGEVFTAEILAKILEIDPREMLSCLSTELEKKHRLIKADSIQRRNGQLLSSYRFQHNLFQKYLYSSMDEIERVHLHENVGRALEDLYKDKEGKFSIAPQLVRHFREARIVPKEIDYLYQVGLRAILMSAYQEAINHLSKALDLLMTQPGTKERAEKELSIQLALGQAWIGPEGYGENFQSAYTRARQLGEQLGQIHILCQVLGQLSVGHFVHAQFTQAREIAKESLALAEQINDPIQIILGHWYLGFIWFYLADFITAREHLKFVLDYYDPLQHHSILVTLRGSDAGTSALAYDALCLWVLGYPDQANKKSLEAISLAHNLDHPFTLVDALCYGGCILSAMQHDTQKLYYYAEQMAEVAFNRNFAGWSGQATSFLGEALASQGRYAEGIEKIQESIEEDILISSRLSLIGSLRALAEAELSAGLLEKGLTTIDKAINQSISTGEHLWEPEIYRLKAGLLLSQNNVECAEECLQKSIEIARTQQAKSWEIRSTVDLASLWGNQGKNREARDVLSEIYYWFSEGFDTPDLVKAKKLLEELS